MVESLCVISSTCSKLADGVEQLELPALFHVMDGLSYLAAWGLDVELQAKAVDVSISCRNSRPFEHRSLYICRACATLLD